MKSCCKDAFDNNTVHTAPKRGIAKRLFSIVAQLFGKKKAYKMQQAD